MGAADSLLRTLQPLPPLPPIPPLASADADEVFYDAQTDLSRSSSTSSVASLAVLSDTAAVERGPPAEAPHTAPAFPADPWSPFAFARCAEAPTAQARQAVSQGAFKRNVFTAIHTSESSCFQLFRDVLLGWVHAFLTLYFHLCAG